MSTSSQFKNIGLSLVALVLFLLFWRIKSFVDLNVTAFGPVLLGILLVSMWFGWRADKYDNMKFAGNLVILISFITAFSFLIFYLQEIGVTHF